jgi:hypothetical protein
MQTFYVGTRNRTRVVSVPTCQHVVDTDTHERCGAESQVSYSKGGVTQHRCIAHYRSRTVQDAQLTALLRELGLA